MARRLRVYRDVERASMRWSRGKSPMTFLRLARSVLLAPRSKRFLPRFRAGATAPIERATDAVGPDGWRHQARILNRGRCVVSGDTLEVVTDPQSGGYSALLPLSRPERPDGPVRFHCRIEVIEGSIGVSAVTASCTMLAERIADRPGSYEFEIVVPLAREAAGILVRNYAMTGQPSRVRVSSITAVPCSAELLPRLPSVRPSRVLNIPLRSYGDRVQPRETGDDITQWIGLDTHATVAMVVDAWETLGDRIARNIADKLVPTVAVLRTAGMSIVHISHDQPVHPLARPLEGDIVIPGEFMDADVIADMFRSAGVKHLLYLGYHSNQCLLRRSLGMLEMHKRGFDTILVRDASAARERPESLDGEWFHRAAVHFIEINGGRTTTTDEIQAAVAASRVAG